MTYLDIEVTNTGNTPKVRAGHIFMPGETVAVTVRPADLPEIRACVGLSVRVIASHAVHPSDLVVTPQAPPAPAPDEDRAREDVSNGPGETDATDAAVMTTSDESGQEQDEPKRRGRKSRR